MPNKGALNGTGRPRVSSTAEQRIGCRLRRFSAQSFSDNIDEFWSFDVDDENDGFVVAVPTQVITVPPGLDGVYACHFVFDTADVAYTALGVYVTLNGDRVAANEYGAFTGIGSTRVSAGFPCLALVGGDQLSARTRQDSAGAQNFTNPFFQLFRTGP